MESARWAQIQSLFEQAAVRPDTERAEYLQIACGGDAGMVSEVLAMIEADSQNDSIIDRGLPEIANQFIGHADQAIQLKEVGPYRLIEFIGEGGMGAVYLAQRKDAGNPVAIKFLLHAGLSPARRERFAREIKLLGKLNHPAIARLYDAGALDDGTPWFVMEYVEGKRLLDHCRDKTMASSDLIQLFRRICEAVQYAHGQEIIHRDLKPSNILVDETGAPRLLDFGIAKELHSLDDEAEFTRSGLRLLTPEYAAPEWAERGIVGPYTDVYSLGVILYQLLAHERPQEGTKPSRAVHRISGLSKSEWNDLDSLCLKSIEHDFTQRYQSVEALIRDLDHYLKNEPLEARPPSFRYRLTKFVKRNRRVIVAASVAFAMFLGVATFFTFRLANERNAALAEAARTRRIRRFMLTLFGAEDKAAAPSKELRAITLLDTGAKEASDLHADPETQAEIYQTLGLMYRRLGDPDKAGQLQEQGLEKMKVAFGPDSAKVAEALSQMALLRADQGRLKEAEQLAHDGLSIADRHLPPNDPIVLKAKVALGEVWATSRSYDKAIDVLDPVVRLKPSGEDGTSVLLEGLTALAVAEQYAGHYDRAIALNQRALELDRRTYGQSHPRVAFDLANLGAAEATLGHYPEAEQLYRQSVAIGTSWYGEEQPDVLAAKSILATVLTQQGKLVEAESLLKGVLPLQKKVFGENHPYVSFTLHSLGSLAYKRKDFGAAETYYVRSLDISNALYGEGNFDSAIIETDLGSVFIAKGEYQRAELLLRGALIAVTKHPKPGNRSIGALQAIYGDLLVKLRRYREAEAPLAAGYAVLTIRPSPAIAKRLETTRQDLVTVYTALHQPEKAAKYQAEPAAINSLLLSRSKSAPAPAAK